jgi:hypothetical protein
MITPKEADKSAERCPRCQEPLPAGEAFVLIPDEDVPRSGSRTEFLVTPSRTLRVVARTCALGHVTIDALPLLKTAPPSKTT